MFANKNISWFKNNWLATNFATSNLKYGTKYYHWFFKNVVKNKGFEIIEAYHLFKTSKITVILHPQAILHSAVQYADFSIIGQLSKPSILEVLNYFLYYEINNLNIS